MNGQVLTRSGFGGRPAAARAEARKFGILELAAKRLLERRLEQLEWGRVELHER